MVRFEDVRKSKSRKHRSRNTYKSLRQSARRRPVLPRKGVTQSSYEAGFFDFLRVFWNNNEKMELRSLTRQVANAWEALLPKPKLSKKQIIKDYSKEFQALKDEEKRLQEQIKSQIEEHSGTETAASTVDGNESQSEKHDGERKERTSTSREVSASGDESLEENDPECRRGVKRKREGRKYESYEAYQAAKNKKNKPSMSENESNRNNTNQNKEKHGKQENGKQKTEDGVFFPIREETSFDRIVKNHYDDQNEMLRKLKNHGRCSDPNAPKYNIESTSSNSLSSNSAGCPKLPSQDTENNRVSPKLSSPTDTLLVKNLVVGIRQPELQEIFKVFLKDIVLIRVLDNKYNGEAVVEFKNVEAAERVWKQMNGVEYKRLPLVLEFANKEDLIY